MEIESGQHAHLFIFAAVFQIFLKLLWKHFSVCNFSFMYRCYICKFEVLLGNFPETAGRSNERLELHILKPLKPAKFPAYKHLKFVFFFCTCWFYCTEMKNRTSIYSLFCLFYTWMSLYFLIAFSNGSLDSRQLDFSKYLVHLLEKVTKYLKSCWSSDVTFHYLQVWFWICLFLCSARQAFWFSKTSYFWLY